MKDEFLELLVKAIDDALNHAHYSLMHSDIEPPMEHNEWKRQWLLKNLPLYKNGVTNWVPEPEYIFAKARQCDEKDFAQWMWELQYSKSFDCSKYNKREGQGCDLNNNCKYPNCNYICHG